MAIKCPKCQSENSDTAKFCSECATPLQPSIDIGVTKTLETPFEQLSAGSTLAGRYRIIEELGKGGMGTVYKAHDQEINEKVAIKLLKTEIVRDEKTIERFRNELKIARSVSHKHVCRMYDIGREDEKYFITMEYVAGDNLKSLIKEKQKVPENEVIRIAQQICEGLAGAHELGIVHRDLKPQNIMMNKKGDAKIMDFGIARSVEAQGMTQTGVIIGTPDYISPEQAEGQEADHRSDIYSLGVILYEMVTGSVPFKGDTALSVALKHKSQLPSDPKKLNPEVSDALSRLILICMEKERERRYQTAKALLVDLHNIEDCLPLGTKIRPRRETFVAAIVQKKLFIPALIVVLAIITAIAFMVSRKSGPGLDPRRIVVAPFENKTGDPSLDPIATLTADAVTQGLVALGEVEVVPAPDDSSLGDDLILRSVAREVGAGTMVTGSFYLTGEILDLRARVIDVSSGKPIYALKPETGTHDQPSEVVDRMRERIMSALMMHVRHEPFIGNPPLYSAYQEYYASITTISVDWHATVEHLERAVELDPEFWPPQVNLVQAYFFVRDEARLEAQRDHLNRNQDKLSRADRLNWQYIEARIEGNLLEAFRKARERLTIDPRNFGWIFNAARLAVNLNRPREALKMIGDVKKLDWDVAGTWFQNHLMITTAARAHHMLGEHEDELEVVEFGLELYPDLVSVRRDQVQALAALGRIQDVDRIINESLAAREPWLNPGQVMLTAATELRAHGYQDDALRVANRCAEWCASSADEDVVFTQFVCLWLAERRDEARALIEQAFESNPKSLSTQIFRGIAAASAGDREVAEAMDHELAALNDPYRRNSLTWSRACIAAQLGERERAVELLHEAPGRAFEMHASPYLEPLRGYPPFEELLRPKE